LTPYVRPTPSRITNARKMFIIGPPAMMISFCHDFF